MGRGEERRIDRMADELVLPELSGGPGADTKEPKRPRVDPVDAFIKENNLVAYGVDEEVGNRLKVLLDEFCRPETDKKRRAEIMAELVRRQDELRIPPGQVSLLTLPFAVPRDYRYAPPESTLPAPAGRREDEEAAAGVEMMPAAAGGGGRRGGGPPPGPPRRPEGPPPAEPPREPQPERPEGPRRWGDGLRRINREEARQILASPDYQQLNPQERAEVRRVAEVSIARPTLGSEAPPAMPFVLNDLRENYHQVRDRLKREKAIELNIAEGDYKTVAAAFKADELNTREDLLAGCYHILVGGIYRKDWTINETNQLAGLLNKLATVDIEAFATMQTIAESAYWLIDYWRRDFAGLEGVNFDMIRASGGATMKAKNTYINTLLMDKGIELAMHNASTRDLDELRYQEETLVTVNDGRVTKTESVFSQDQQGRRISRNPEEVINDVIGEILDRVTLKVRDNPKEASKFDYSVYRTDQPGMQLSEGKYNHAAFERLLRRNSKGGVEVIWNNGRHTLFTFANSEPLVNKWFKLINKSNPNHDSYDPNINIGERQIAWLIGYAGDGIDGRLLDYEALDFEDWLTIEDTAERRRILQIYLDHFNAMREAGGDFKTLAEKAIRANLARARTVWNPEAQSVYGGPITYRRFSDIRGIPIMELGLDLDAVRWNGEANDGEGDWEFCLNFRWFFQDEKGYFQDISFTEGKEVPAEERDRGPYIIAEAGKELSLNLSTLHVYEGYKQTTHNDAIEPNTRAKAFKDFRDRPESLDALSSEKYFKEIYAVPEYREALSSHLINRITLEEMLASVYKERFAGRKLNYYKLARDRAYWLEWTLNNNLHFRDINIRGNWLQANRMMSLFPGYRLRQAFMDYSQIESWQHFAERHDVDLETLLLFAGYEQDGEQDGYFLAEFLNRRRVSYPMTGDEREMPDRYHDNYYEGIWGERLLSRLRQEPALAERLVRLGKEVAPDEDGIWALNLASIIRRRIRTAPDAVLADVANRLETATNTIRAVESNDWRFLTPLDVMRLGRRLNLDFEEDVEFPRPENWVDAGARIRMINFHQSRSRTNKRTRDTLIPIGPNKGRRLYDGWYDDPEMPGYGTRIERPDQLGLSIIRNLNGGWWEFQPETGLSEGGPWYIEKEIIFFLGAMYTAPYRLWTSEVMSDIDYRASRGLAVDYRLTDADRQTGLYRTIYDKHLSDQMRVAAGPDVWENVMALLTVLGSHVESGKSIVDLEPARRYGRYLGAWNPRDPNALERFRDRAINRLNLREGRILPAPGSPEQIRRAYEAFQREIATRGKEWQKFILFPEGLEMAGFFGLSLEQQLGSGETTADDWYQRRYGIGAAAVAPTVYWGSIGTLLAMAGVEAVATTIGSSLFLLVGSNLVAPIIGWNLGYAFGTDVHQTDIESGVSRPLVKIGPVSFGRISAQGIARWQRRLRRFFPTVYSRRQDEAERGGIHAALMHPGALAGFIETMQKEYGV